MRYLITAVHDAPEPTGAPAELYEAMGAFVTQLTEDGVLVDAAGLAPVEKAIRIILRGGEVSVSDGPFAETKEWIGGYFILEVASEAEAIDYAKQSVNLHRKHFPGFEIIHEVREILQG